MDKTTKLPNNDPDCYRQQIISIYAAIQRNRPSGTHGLCDSDCVAIIETLAPFFRTEQSKGEVVLPDDVELLRRASQVPYLLENYRELSDDIDDVACEMEDVEDGAVSPALESFRRKQTQQASGDVPECGKVNGSLSFRNERCELPSGHSGRHKTWHHAGECSFVDFD